MPRDIVHEYPGKLQRPQAKILEVEPFSPADDAGFTPGCIITAVDGHPVRDILDWQWLTDYEEIELSYIDTDGDEGTVELFREEGENWGITFDGALFDRIKTCRNNCVFCFMNQLPRDVRSSLILRDDDFRLSFLQGNFVTLTNLSEEDAQRIIEQGISPLHVSLHASDPEVRRNMIGRNAARGIEMMDRLLDAGIEMYTQIVLCPDLNDGKELMKTLAWAYMRPGILNVAIVPLGFTKHQDRFSESFNDQERAKSVIDLIEPFQKHALAERGALWVHVADEFYRNAFPDDVLGHLPPTENYGEFEMFEDGIGILRSMADEWFSAVDLQQNLADALEEEGLRIIHVFGCAQREMFPQLLENSPLKGYFEPLFVPNEYYGGNVDVTGLLSGIDVSRALQDVSAYDYVVLPRIMFNSDGLTVDDMTVDDIRDTAGIPVSVVSCSPIKFLSELEEIVRG